MTKAKQFNWLMIFVDFQLHLYLFSSTAAVNEMNALFKPDGKVPKALDNVSIPICISYQIIGLLKLTFYMHTTNK